MESARWENIRPIYQSIRETVKTTGLSEFMLRKMYKAGTLPHIMSGNKVLINVPVLLHSLYDGGESHDENRGN